MQRGVGLSGLAPARRQRIAVVGRGHRHVELEVELDVVGFADAFQAAVDPPLLHFDGRLDLAVVAEAAAVAGAEIVREALVGAALREVEVGDQGLVVAEEGVDHVLAVEVAVEHGGGEAAVRDRDLDPGLVVDADLRGEGVGPEGLPLPAPAGDRAFRLASLRPSLRPPLARRRGRGCDARSGDCHRAAARTQQGQTGNTLSGGISVHGHSFRGQRSVC